MSAPIVTAEDFVYGLIGLPQCVQDKENRILTATVGIDRAIALVELRDVDEFQRGVRVGLESQAALRAEVERLRGANAELLAALKEEEALAWREAAAYVSKMPGPSPDERARNLYRLAEAKKALLAALAPREDEDGDHE